MSFHLRKSSIISMICVIWKNINTRCPLFLNLGKTLSNNSNLPLTLQIKSLVSLSEFNTDSTSSKTNGWLQIFRNCIILLFKPLIPLLAPPTSAPTNNALCLSICWYNTYCNPDKLHFKTFSTLSGKSFSTSFFNLLKRNGLRTLCNLRITNNDSSSVNSIFSWAPVLANGVLNQSSKDLTELKIPGKTKFNNAHNSGKLFCNGVPVKINLFLVL